MQQLRLFIALELPPDIQRVLASSFQKLALNDDIYRRTPRMNLHLTLKFIGDTPLSDLPSFTSALESFEGEPAPAVMLEKGRFLPPARPRTAVIRVAPDDSLLRLQASIDQLLSDEGLSQPERRRFSPHITVARLRGAPDPADSEILSAWSPVAEPFTAHTLILFQSELTPVGPNYTPLVTVALL